MFLLFQSHTQMGLMEMHIPIIPIAIFMVTGIPTFLIRILTLTILM